METEIRRLIEISVEYSGKEYINGKYWFRTTKFGVPKKIVKYFPVYEINGEKYQRTYFGSYPAKAMVYHFESSTNTSYSIAYNSPHKKMDESFTDGIYAYKGQVEDNGMEFETCLKIDTDGKVSFDNGELQISDAKYFTVCHVAATDYTLEYPKYKGFDFVADNKNSLANLEGKTFEEIREIHQNDYQNLYARVELDLGENHRDSVPTNRRLREYAKGTNDPGLEQIYFQYSRYMMIAASRPGTMPMHLQGKWNNSTRPPWAADYHSNIRFSYWRRSGHRRTALAT